MPEVAYLFERFPSFGQTFCYREVAALEKQGTTVQIFSIRRPADEPPQDWDPELVRRVHYLPGEGELVAEIDRALRKDKSLAATRKTVEEWGRKPDFLRLYQAVYVGLRLQQSGVRHLHAHFAGMAARTAFWINRFFGTPYSFTAHANDIFAPRDFFVSLEKLMGSAAAIVTVSDFSATDLKERFPGSALKVHRIYNGIGLSGFQRADPGSSLPAIVSVGRLIEKKGFADLIEACRLLKANRAFTCEIIGEGPLEAALRSQIAEAGLEGSVKLAGPRTQSDIVERLAKATIFVLPCTREAGGGMDNLPTVIMEAMAAGLPVISTPLAGVPEMVEDGVNGELVPERDPKGISAAMERLLGDPARAREMGDRGREIAAEKFSIETSARALQKLFGSL